MCVFFFKQKTAYEMRISDWSSDVCSSDLQCNQLVFCRGTHGATHADGELTQPKRAGHANIRSTQTQLVGNGTRQLQRLAGQHQHKYLAVEAAHAIDHRQRLSQQLSYVTHTVIGPQRAKTLGQRLKSTNDPVQHHQRTKKEK